MKFDENIIQKMLVISTSHIKESTSHWLSGEIECPRNIIAYEKSEYGFLILVQDDEDREDLVNVPSDFQHLYQYARSLGIDWIMLDRDAPKIQEIPSYSWN